MTRIKVSVREFRENIASFLKITYSHCRCQGARLSVSKFLRAASI